MKITIAGAGAHGSTLAYRIAAGGYADEVVHDRHRRGPAQGLALDMMHGRALEGFATRVVGTNRYDETEGSAVCVIAAGHRREAGMSRGDLLDVNAKVVAEVTKKLVERSPDAVLIVATNPIDEMLALCQAKSGLPHRRVIGEAGLLNVGRWKHIISERFGTTPDKVEGIVLGSHGDTMVPDPVAHHRRRPPAHASCSTPPRSHSSSRRRGPLPSEIIAYLKSGSGYFAAAVAGEIDRAGHRHRQR